MRNTLIIILLTWVLLKSHIYAGIVHSFDGGNSDGILSNGQIYMLEISESGVFKIDMRWITDNLNIQSGSLSSSEIQVYGIAGGALGHDDPYELTPRLKPLPLQIVDGNDGKFDNQDYFLFYAEGVDLTYFDSEEKLIKVNKNPFAERAFVILKISNLVEQCLIDNESDQPASLRITNDYWFADIYHDDKVNLLDAFISTQGSGQTWYSDELSNVGTFDLTKHLSVPLSGLKNVVMEVNLASRSRLRESISLSYGVHQTTREIPAVNTEDIEALYARNARIVLEGSQLNTNDAISIQFNKSDPDGKAWLDFASVQGISEAKYSEGQMLLVNPPLLGQEAYDGLAISSDKQISIWDITDIHNIINKFINDNNGKKTFSITYPQLNRYICFSNESLLVPKFLRQVENQDLIKKGQVELIIVTPPTIFDAATRLKTHRAVRDNLTSAIVSPQEIYNEYSAGRQDPTAIRNYVRDVYHRYANFQFLLLLGDASFDYRHINKNHPADNLVPTFETFNSLDPLLAFPSDDYFALLDNDENGHLIGDLDIAVGRLTIRNPKEAKDVINKIIIYDQQGQLAPWKTKVVFLADDEDNNLHINDADVIATEVNKSNPLLNQEKIYFDAFRQESTPGGNRYPSATKRLNQTVANGALVINYLGHGGPNGWAQERVLKVDDINSWKNINRLPLIITATCSFTGFDDPSTSTAGEAALLNPLGGALSLFTTVRSVYASKNFRLTRSVFSHLFEKSEGKYIPIGEIMRRAKNEHLDDNTNARKFFLIGDPTLRLGIPNLDIKTDKINGKTIDEDQESIRVSALDQVHISASIRDPHDSIIKAYNGVVDIVVFDKASDIKTFANDNRSFVKSFKSQQNVIYKGRTKVISGMIDITFTIPVDIDYVLGDAKISYFSTSDNDVEAVGFTERLSIGGASVAPVRDDTPPVIDAYLNNRSFRNGDKVPPSNKVLIDIMDDFGLNISSTGIGHEMSAVLDNESRSTIFLNDLLVGRQEDPLSGTITFDLKDLSPGPHELVVKAFDVANNVGEASIQFEISDDIEKEILSIDASPNPLSIETTFEIAHDFFDDELAVSLRVFDLLGRLVEEHDSVVLSRSGIISVIWAPITQSPGPYLCHFTIKSRTLSNSTLTAVKKVVLLK